MTPSRRFVPEDPGGGPAPVFLAQARAWGGGAAAHRRASPTDVRMVLYGEPGVGKTHAARFLHRFGPRARCPLLRQGLADPKAAAQLAAGGFLEAARGGTLILEDVDRAGAELQALLVGLLERWEAPEGGEATVRIVSTARRDLLTGVEEGWFRKDLYYLLEVFPVALPPLRERPEEIPLYVSHFFGRHAPGRREPPIPEVFLVHALSYAWPGNLRELENLVVSALPAEEGGPWRLPPSLPRRGADPEPLPFAQAKREFEKAYVQRLLLLTEGNVTQAAEFAGKARKDFYALMARNRIDPDTFRRGAST
ncbi:MAG: sigma 54-interacting transcriptional regulator [Thermodesulfobacteriota bacterium]